MADGLDRGDLGLSRCALYLGRCQDLKGLRRTAMGTLTLRARANAAQEPRRIDRVAPIRPRDAHLAGVRPAHVQGFDVVVRGRQRAHSNRFRERNGVRNRGVSRMRVQRPWGHAMTISRSRAQAHEKSYPSSRDSVAGRTTLRTGPINPQGVRPVAQRKKDQKCGAPTRGVDWSALGSHVVETDSIHEGGEAHVGR